ncbi:hypothetical protein HanIR_Chr02g0083701 [Helianthus annuus]|nr:hypothetical protein HanIR_Chr02g0083701 [Helianthus annuus]
MLGRMYFRKQIFIEKRRCDQESTGVEGYWEIQGCLKHKTNTYTCVIP